MKMTTDPTAPRVPEELPELERVRESWADEDYDADPSATDRSAYEDAMRRTFSSIEEAIRHARKIAPGTVMGPAPDDGAGDEKQGKGLERVTYVPW